MAEQMIVVCDVCGKPATETVTIKVSRGNFVKDLCAQHVTELTAGARKPRPGRPRKLAGEAAATPRRRGRPRKTAGEAAATPRRRGRPRKTAAKSNGRRTARRKTTRRKSTGRRKAQSSSSSS
jgi:hypothetical protein